MVLLRTFAGSIERMAVLGEEKGAAAKLHRGGERVGLQQIAEHDGWHGHEGANSWRMSHYECRNAADFAGRRAGPKEKPFEWRAPDKHSGKTNCRAGERRRSCGAEAARLCGRRESPVERGAFPDAGRERGHRSGKRLF